MGYIRHYYCDKCGKDLSCDVDIETEFTDAKRSPKIYHTANCLCGGNIEAGFPKVSVNICSAGDFKPFFSPDLGVFIDSSKKLNDTLKARGMVNLQESREYRQSEQNAKEKVMQMPSIRGALKKK